MIVRKLLSQYWQNISVVRKLYFVVGIMAALICIELFTLHFAMTTLSAVRAFVGGEALWSKAQKSASYNLQRYIQTKDPQYYVNFKEFIAVPLGDHLARVEMEKPVIDMKAIERGFVIGQNHPDDVEKMVKLVRRFYWVPYLARAIDYWRQADTMLAELITLAEKVHFEIQRKHNPHRKANLDKLLLQISDLDEKLTGIETGFSNTLGEASRWLEGVLLFVLLCAVFTIEGTGVFLTISFSRGLSLALNELNHAAGRVGEGDFEQRVPVRSKDELGQLAEAINTMTVNLQAQVKGRQSAEHDSEIKNLFLANMSHEMRTPLNAVLGFAELLKSPDLTEQERNAYLAIIQRTGNNLLTIINDILDISQLEAESVKINPTAFSMNELMSDLVQILHFRTEAKGISLTVKKIGDFSDNIECDPGRLRQILMNIIGNAIKFTSEGGVSVEYGIEDNFLVFYVRDTGVGISPEQAEKLFKPFSQGDSSVRKKFGGTGLGLLISRKLARLLGGDVLIQESKKDSGSVFRIWVEYKSAQAAPSIEEPVLTQADFAKWTQKRILICEDSKDNQTLIRAYLAKIGVTADIANNGEEGLQFCEKKNYDLILMDMQMPILDGFAATKKLRELGFKKPIVALTGYAMKQDREKCLAAGCSGFLPKPFTSDELYRALMIYLSGEQHDEAA